MPSGVFRPYAGVSTAVLLFTKGGTTEKIWFYDMEHDGYSLDDKRQKVPENDIPNALECWAHRLDAKFHVTPALLSSVSAPWLCISRVTPSVGDISTHSFARAKIAPRASHRPAPPPFRSARSCAPWYRFRY